MNANISTGLDWDRIKNIPAKDFFIWTCLGDQFLFTECSSTAENIRPILLLDPILPTGDRTIDSKLCVISGR